MHQSQCAQNATGTRNTTKAKKVQEETEKGEHRKKCWKEKSQDDR